MSGHKHLFMLTMWILLAVFLPAFHLSAGEAEMLKLFDRAHNLSPRKNLLLSPYGIEQCFGLAACGSGKQSGRELADILGIDPSVSRPGIPAETYGTRATFNSFNAVFYNRNYTLLPGFIRLCRNIYNGKIYKLDFRRPAECAKIINALIKKESRDLLDNAISPDLLTNDDAAVLLNVLYFKGGWSEPFSTANTERKTFYPADQAPYDTDMMYAKQEYAYFEKDGIQAVFLPFDDYRFKMLLIKTADKTAPLNKVTGFLAENGLRYIEKNSSYGYEVHIHLPKLKLNGDNDLIPLLKAAGMNVIFDPHHSDIDRMIAEQPLYIAGAKQLVKLNVDEKGAEVAAATIILPKAASAPGTDEVKVREFRADHPFVIVLFDWKHRNILLTAAVLRP
ncbi:MAG: serpin family protein [Lentisphaerae bacterium]|nr:serpin family protein [Lentisphaerota bacterium]